MKGFSCGRCADVLSAQWAKKAQPKGSTVPCISTKAMLDNIQDKVCSIELRIFACRVNMVTEEMMRQSQSCSQHLDHSYHPCHHENSHGGTKTLRERNQLHRWADDATARVSDHATVFAQTTPVFMVQIDVCCCWRSSDTYNRDSYTNS